MQTAKTPTSLLIVLPGGVLAARPPPQRTASRPVIAAEHPSISKATVYRNLNQLAVQGEILRVPVPTGADRFDFNTQEHYHVRCTECGNVYDVFMPPISDLLDRVTDSSDVELTHYDILFEGVCAACRNK